AVTDLLHLDGAGGDGLVEGLVGEPGGRLPVEAEDLKPAGLVRLADADLGDAFADALGHGVLSCYPFWHERNRRRATDVALRGAAQLRAGAVVAGAVSAGADGTAGAGDRLPRPAGGQRQRRAARGGAAGRLWHGAGRPGDAGDGGGAGGAGDPAGA